MSDYSDETKRLIWKNLLTPGGLPPGQKVVAEYRGKPITEKNRPGKRSELNPDDVYSGKRTQNLRRKIFQIAAQKGLSIYALLCAYDSQKCKVVDLNTVPRKQLLADLAGLKAFGTRINKLATERAIEAELNLPDGTLFIDPETGELINYGYADVQMKTGGILPALGNEETKRKIESKREQWKEEDKQKSEEGDPDEM